MQPAVTDELDLAADRAELERAAALSRHAARPRVAARCEACGEPAHVTPRGLTWRFCVGCADEHLRLVREGQTA